MLISATLKTGLFLGISSVVFGSSLAFQSDLLHPRNDFPWPLLYPSQPNLLELNARENIFHHTDIIIKTTFLEKNQNNCHKIFNEQSSIDDFTPKFKSEWAQSILVSVDPPIKNKNYTIGTGFGYKIQNYAYYSWRDGRFIDIPWPSLVIPFNLSASTNTPKWNTRSNFSFELEFDDETISKNYSIYNELMDFKKFNSIFNIRFSMLYSQKNHISSERLYNSDSYYIRVSIYSELI